MSRKKDSKVSEESNVISLDEYRRQRGLKTKGSALPEIISKLQMIMAEKAERKKRNEKIIKALKKKEL